MFLSKDNLLELYYRMLTEKELKKGKKERIVQLKNILNSLNNINLDKNNEKIK